ncbi:MAG: hypothetical protein HQM06_13200 [Magnetococcales bacterium]|nr:hypothetical protein [Magnetococcales bacterium]
MSIKPSVTNLQQCRGKVASPAITARRKQIFLETLATCGVVRRAAEVSGTTRKSLYTYRTSDPDFAEAWDIALQDFADRLEEAAHSRAVDGYEEPVFQGGQQVGTVRKYSDSLLLAMLRARRPEYQSKPTVTVQAPPFTLPDMPQVYVDPSGNSFTLVDGQLRPAAS